MAKNFFYVCAGICLLALSYHFGAQSANAQGKAPGSLMACSGASMLVMTPNGDVYLRSMDKNMQQPDPGAMDAAPPFVLLGNFWGAKRVIAKSPTGGK